MHRSKITLFDHGLAHGIHSRHSVHLPKQGEHWQGKQERDQERVRALLKERAEKHRRVIAAVGIARASKMSWGDTLFAVVAATIVSIDGASLGAFVGGLLH
jgi:hypothetical protein